VTGGLKFPKGAPHDAVGFYELYCDGTKKCYVQCPDLHWSGYRKKYECAKGRGVPYKLPGKRFQSGQFTKTEVIARVLHMDFQDTLFTMHTLADRVLLRYPARHYNVRVVFQHARATKLIEDTGTKDSLGRKLWRMKK
jgi:hypothetical protein